MNEATAKIRISISEGLIEIEGAESFVSSQTAILHPFIESIFKSRGLGSDQGRPGGLPTDPPAPEGPEQNGSTKYQNIIEESDGTIHILKAVPGSNNAQKMVNVAMLLALGYSSIGTTSITSNTIRSACKTQACLDASNFASTIKEQNNLFIITGSGRSWNLKLTLPGKQQAEQLAASLNT